MDCWSLFDILRCATLLRVTFPYQPIEIRNREQAINNEFEWPWTKSK